MQFNERREYYARKLFSYSKLFLAMKLAIILVIAACLQATAGAFAQKITIHEKEASLTKVLKLVKDQTGLNFFYDNNILKDNQIYKVAPDGTVTLYAGDPSGRTGNIEGIGTAGRFTAPVGIVMDSQGTMFVAEVNGNIKKIAPNGMVTMYAASASIGASGLAIDKNNTLYIGARPGSFFAFVYITANGAVNYDYDIYADPEGRMGIDGSGAIYASDVNATGRYAIGDGTYERLIGDGFTPGYADGDYSDARFGKVGNMVWNKKDLLMVCDPENNALRSINPATKKVGTIFKTPKGFQDGGLLEAKFGDITDVNVGPDGSIYVLDKANKAIRKITL